MARWTDLAEWRGPTVNHGGAMLEQRGLVIHIAEGGYEGTIAWQKNPTAQVSSHFVTDYDGKTGQVVDTDMTAWTQQAGNGHWLSVENAGFTPNGLTAAQCEAIAQLFARGHRQYGWPLQLANGSSGRGLGHHSMGGTAWGHLDCPGPAIIGQKPAILARAIQIVNGTPPPQEEDDDMHRVRSGITGDGSIYLVPGFPAPSGKMAAYGLNGPTNAAYDTAGVKLVQLPAGVSVAACGLYDTNPQPWSAGGAGGSPGPTAAEIATAVVDLEHDRLAS